MTRHSIPLTVLLLLTIGLGSCTPAGTSGKQPLLFSVQDDITLGKQVKAEIEANPTEYPVLDPARYPAAYAYLNKLVGNILNSGQIRYRNEFAWEFRIIAKDDVANAFCTPGGYIYVYTGLIKMLDSDDQLAGVLGHEIGHADLRHSTRNLEKAYGIELLTAVVLGNGAQGQLSQIAKGLIGLRFSRDFEREADNQSVTYLCPTAYRADGAAAFFEKIVAEGQAGGTDWFSTHPDPGDRITAIRQRSKDASCAGKEGYASQYADFKRMLP
jgi:beta-barrel assembly-enhancing protease